jgi:hypothetical protein
VRAIISVEVVSRYGVSSNISDILCIAGLYFFFLCVLETQWGCRNLKKYVMFLFAVSVSLICNYACGCFLVLEQVVFSYD